MFLCGCLLFVHKTIAWPERVLLTTVGKFSLDQYFAMSRLIKEVYLDSNTSGYRVLKTQTLKTFLELRDVPGKRLNTQHAWFSLAVWLYWNQTWEADGSICPYLLPQPQTCYDFIAIPSNVQFINTSTLPPVCGVHSHMGTYFKVSPPIFFIINIINNFSLCWW